MQWFIPVIAKNVLMIHLCLYYKRTMYYCYKNLMMGTLASERLGGNGLGNVNSMHHFYLATPKKKDSISSIHNNK